MAIIGFEGGGEEELERSKKSSLVSDMIEVGAGIGTGIEVIEDRLQSSLGIFVGG